MDFNQIPVNPLTRPTSRKRPRVGARRYCLETRRHCMSPSGLPTGNKMLVRTTVCRGVRPITVSSSALSQFICPRPISVAHASASSWAACWVQCSRGLPRSGPITTLAFDTKILAAQPGRLASCVMVFSRFGMRCPMRERYSSSRLLLN